MVDVLFLLNVLSVDLQSNSQMTLTKAMQQIDLYNLVFARC